MAKWGKENEWYKSFVFTQQLPFYVTLIIYLLWGQIILPKVVNARDYDVDLSLSDKNINRFCIFWILAYNVYSTVIEILQFSSVGWSFSRHF